MDRNKRNRDFTLEIVIHLTRIRLLKHRFKNEFSVLQRTLRAIYVCYAAKMQNDFCSS